MDNKENNLKIEELKFFKKNSYDVFYKFCKNNKIVTLEDLLLHLYNKGIKADKKPSFYELNGIINLIKYEYLNLLCIDEKILSTVIDKNEILEIDNDNYYFHNKIEACLKQLGFSRVEMRYFFNMIDNDLVGKYTIGELILFAEIRISLCLNIHSIDVLKNKVSIVAKYYRENVYKENNEFLIKNLYVLKMSLCKHTEKINQIDSLIKSLKGDF